MHTDMENWQEKKKASQGSETYLYKYLWYKRFKILDITQDEVKSDEKLLFCPEYLVCRHLWFGLFCVHAQGSIKSAHIL